MLKSPPNRRRFLLAAGPAAAVFATLGAAVAAQAPPIDPQAARAALEAYAASMGMEAKIEFRTKAPTNAELIEYHTRELVAAQRRASAIPTFLELEV